MKKGSHHTPETKEKFSVIGKNRSTERMEKMRKGRTIESFVKQSETMKKRFPPGQTHYNYGKRRSEESKEKMRASALGKHIGSRNGKWKGGRFKHNLGYICIMNFYHPYKNRRGYVFEHRLVIEKQIERFLKPEEACHHINKVKDDNRPENLIAFKTQGAHNSFEAGHPIDPSDIIFDGRNFHVKAS